MKTAVKGYYLSSLLWICAASSPQQVIGPQNSHSHIDLSVMDQTADPCEDFYKYSCGAFSKAHPLQAGQEYLFLSQLQQENPFLQVSNLLARQPPKGEQRSAANEALAQYYGACMDVSSLDARGLAPLMPLLKQISDYRQPGQLPVLLAALTMVRSYPLFQLSVVSDQNESGKQIAELDVPSLVLRTRNAYLNTGAEQDELRQKYRAHIARVLVLAGYTEGQAELQAAKVFDVEKDFATASLTAVQDRDPSLHQHPSTVHALGQQASSFSWAQYFAAVGTPAIGKLNIDSPAALEVFQALLAQHDSALIRAILTFRLVESIPPLFLPHELAEESQSFRGIIHAADNGPRSVACAIQVARARKDDLLRLYLSRFTPPTLKTDAVAFVLSIEKELGPEFEEADWMSTSTKQHAKLKLASVVNNVAYPDLTGSYETVPVVPKDGLANYLAATRSNARLSLAKIGQPVDRGVSYLGPMTAAGAYFSECNEIEIPAAELLPPNFDLGAPDAENYGRAGYVVGHELVHGYDDKGRLFDEIGALKGWWTPEDAAHFEQRSSCFVSEYEQFAVDEMHHVNGHLTLGENIADNGGVHLALKAFLDKAKAKDIDVDKPEDGITPLQRFFLSYAQDTCSVVRPESELLQIENNPHTLDRFRANGVVRNLPEFGQAYSCKKGQPMMPEQICRIW